MLEGRMVNIREPIPDQHIAWDAISLDGQTKGINRQLALLIFLI